MRGLVSAGIPVAPGAQHDPGCGRGIRLMRVVKLIAERCHPACSVQRQFELTEVEPGHQASR